MPASAFQGRLAKQTAPSIYLLSVALETYYIGTAK